MRARKRKSVSPLMFPIPKRQSATSSPSPSTSRAVTPASSECEEYNPFPVTPLSATMSEPLLSNYSAHELPDVSGESFSETFDVSSHDVDTQQQQKTETQVLVNTALVARIESLEAEIRLLNKKFLTHRPSYFRLKNIAHVDSLIHFYTGFQSYEILLAFYDFLGPSVNNLRYWGSKSTTGLKR